MLATQNPDALHVPVIVSGPVGCCPFVSPPATFEKPFIFVQFVLELLLPPVSFEANIRPQESLVLTVCVAVNVVLLPPVASMLLSTVESAPVYDRAHIETVFDVGKFTTMSLVPDDGLPMKYVNCLNDEVGESWVSIDVMVAPA